MAQLLRHIIYAKTCARRVFIEKSYGSVIPLFLLAIMDLKDLKREGRKQLRYLILVYELYIFMCIKTFNMRTNIDIDEELLNKILKEEKRFKTKKDVVNAALLEFYKAIQRQKMLELGGKVTFFEGYIEELKGSAPAKGKKSRPRREGKKGI